MKSEIDAIVAEKIVKPMNSRIMDSHKHTHTHTHTHRDYLSIYLSIYAFIQRMYT